MNDRLNNSLKSMAISFFIIIPIIFLVDNLLKNSTEMFNVPEYCNDPNVACDPVSAPLIPLIFAIVTFLIYMKLFNYFEKKRLKSWRSYR